MQVSHRPVAVCVVDQQMELQVQPGEIELLIGGSSDDTPLRQKLMLTGAPRQLSQRQIVATQATAP